MIYILFRYNSLRCFIVTAGREATFSSVTSPDQPVKSDKKTTNCQIGADMYMRTAKAQISLRIYPYTVIVPDKYFHFFLHLKHIVDTRH